MRVRSLLLSLSLVTACSSEGETGSLLAAAVDASRSSNGSSDSGHAERDASAEAPSDAGTLDASVDEMDASTDEMDASHNEMDSGLDSSPASHVDASDSGSSDEDAASDDEDGGHSPDGGDGGGTQGDLVVVYDPIDAGADCEKLIELRAFNPNAPNEGFQVGQNVSDTYECFDFEVPYDGKMQALQIEPIIGDKRVVHDWRVYDASGSTTGKQYWNCTGQHPAAQLLAGWAPGRGVTFMPRGVGLRLPQKGSGKFTLEIHYNNAGHAAGVKDRSGARICATSKLKTNEAAVHWLGTEAIFGTSAVGTCSVPKTRTTPP